MDAPRPEDEMSDIARKVAAKYVAPIDPVELAVRMLEAAGQLKRPEGATPAQAFFSMDTEDQEAWLRAAHAAMLYWRECISDMNATS